MYACKKKKKRLQSLKKAMEAVARTEVAEK